LVVLLGVSVRDREDSRSAVGWGSFGKIFLGEAEQFFLVECLLLSLWHGSPPKCSAATIGVDRSVIARINRLKTLSVELNWGGKGAKKKIKLVRSDEPQSLVFQSVRKGGPMRDGNILRRHLRPAAEKLGINPKKATWRSLRTSCATWMIEAGANPKDVQGQMRHSRISTTMDIYAQHVPESQRIAVGKMMDMVAERRARAQQAQSTSIN